MSSDRADRATVSADGVPAAAIFAPRIAAMGGWGRGARFPVKFQINMFGLNQLKFKRANINILYMYMY